MKKKLVIRNQVCELARVASFVEDLSAELRLDMEARMNLNLALEEMVSNVIFYAYPKDADGCIELMAESDGRELTLVLSDQGREFDPTLKSDTDMNVNPAERELGGMGIFIVKNILDEVSYQRQEGRNLLTMKMRL